jgi:hypothetical protein
LYADDGYGAPLYGTNASAEAKLWSRWTCASKGKLVTGEILVQVDLRVQGKIGGKDVYLFVGIFIPFGNALEILDN